MPQTPEVPFRFSTTDDDEDIRALLSSAGLPTSDVRTGPQEYLLARRDGRLAGCIGLERSGDDALLRSFAVAPELRNLGLGSQLYDRIVAHAAQRGVRAAYVLTTTAERFCAARGFERIERSAVPPALRSAPEFASLCPSSAACMWRRLGGA